MNQEQTQLQRMLKFGLMESPRLTINNLNHEAVSKFITHIRNLIRADAFDDSIMQQLMDSATITPLDHGLGCGYHPEGAGGDVPNAT